MNTLSTNATSEPTCPVRTSTSLPSEPRLLSVTQMIRSSVGAPIYLPRHFHLIEPKGEQEGKYVVMVDAGVMNNDPVTSTLVDHLFNAQLSVQRPLVIISIGTGVRVEDQAGSLSNPICLAKTVGFSNNLEKMVQFIKQKSQTNQLVRYYRLQVDLSKAELDKIDDDNYNQ